MNITDNTITIGIADNSIGHTLPNVIILPCHVYCPIAADSFYFNVYDDGKHIVFLSGVVA